MAELLSQLERSLETCLQQRSELRCQLDASALDIELATFQCHSTMHTLQLAAQSSIVPVPASLIASQTEQLNVIQQQMERLTAERKRIAVNHYSSTLMERHHRVLSKLLSTVASMTNVMSSTREKLERAIELRNNRIDEHEETITDLRNHIETTQKEMAMIADIQTQALLEKSVLTETVGQLRNQLSLVEAQASETLNVSLSQNERERQVVARLEATVANLREELNSNVLEMERWTMQQRQEAQQRTDLRTMMEELEKEKEAWKQAATASTNENEVLSTTLSKTKYELEYHGQMLSQQVNDFKCNDVRQRGRINELQEEIRGLKDDLRGAFETIEREKHNASARGSTNSEVMELRERVTYIREKQEIAESKVKAQRDEMEDLARAHRSRTTEQDDMIRRLKVQLVDAQTQEARLFPMQKKVDDLTQQLFELTQESKSLAMEVGKLKAENAKLVLRQLQREEMDKESAVTPVNTSADQNVKMKEEVIFQLQVDNERLRNELINALRERDMVNANLQCMEGRKDFLTKTLEEVQEQVTKLSGQVQRERSLGNTTEQRIFEMRALVPHWRWEEKLRTDRTLALPGSPTNSNMSFRSLNSTLPR